METERINVLIIGSGQAGNPLARKMAAEGKKVVLIESRHMGGTCVNVGCTPTKAYVASARRIWEANHGQELGVIIPSGSRVDLRTVKHRKDDIVREYNQAIENEMQNTKNISLIMGKAAFAGFKTVEVNGRRFFAEQIFINTGASAFVPEEFRNVNYLTNESILELEELPGHLMIAGGSYLGLEFAQIFRRFGSQVTVVEQNSRLISKEDTEVSNAVLEILLSEGIDVRLSSGCVNARTEDGGKITVTVDCLQGEPEVTGTHLLVAVGRKPNTDSLNLQSTGLSTNEKGYIEVKDNLETIVSGIYALGDCNGRGAFTHTSYNDFEIVAANLLDGKDRKVSQRIPTYCMYTDPPLARVGMTKKQAREKGFNILEAWYPMKKVSRAVEKGETKGFMSAVIDADTLRILGATVLGTGGDEVIGSFIQIMHAHMPYTLVGDAVIPHPTVTELIPAMLQTAKSV